MKEALTIITRCHVRESFLKALFHVLAVARVVRIQFGRVQEVIWHRIEISFESFVYNYFLLENDRYRSAERFSVHSERGMFVQMRRK